MRWETHLKFYCFGCLEDILPSFSLSLTLFPLSSAALSQHVFKTLIIRRRVEGQWCALTSSSWMWMERYHLKIATCEWRTLNRLARWDEECLRTSNGKREFCSVGGRNFSLIAIRPEGNGEFGTQREPLSVSMTDPQDGIKCKACYMLPWHQNSCNIDNARALSFIFACHVCWMDIVGRAIEDT